MRSRETTPPILVGTDSLADVRKPVFLIAFATLACLVPTGARCQTNDIFSGYVLGTPYTFAPRPDSKILVRGFFTALDRQPRGYVGELNIDGTLDPSFNPGASNTVSALALQEDGKI